MLDRQDIDALLVGALYGELSSTDQERLNTHLDAHPADRNVLDDLKSAQQVVRTKVASSRIFELQLDPPQAISAQLLQEAARRAPRITEPAHADRVAKEGWFARFVQSFVRHPAMAAAATLVLVVGVAGSIYLKNADHGIAEPHVSQVNAPAAATQKAANGDQLAEDQVRSTGAAAGSSSDGVPVGLADPRDESRVGNDKEAASEGKGGKAKDAPVVTTPSPEPTTTASVDRREAAKPTSMPKAAPRAAVVRGDNAELQPRDLEESKVAKNDIRKSANDPSFDGDVTVAAPRSQGAPGANAAAGGAAHTSANGAVASPPPPPPQQAPTAPAPVTAATAKAPADSNYAWAKDQHARVAALVKAGNCQDAAPLAVAIKNRDPEYYNAFVASDRALKPCMQYVLDAADREAEKKPAKARVNTDAK